MSERITALLREWNKRAFGSKPGAMAAQHYMDICTVADRIDVAMESAKKKAYEDGFMEAVSKITDYGSDEYLAAHGLVRLPVDAEGKPWHVGDCIWFMQPPHDRYVTSLLLRNDGWKLLCDGDIGNLLEPSDEAHYKPTTAERIREIVKRAPENFTDEDAKDLLAIADELEGADDD